MHNHKPNSKKPAGKKPASKSPTHSKAFREAVKYAKSYADHPEQLKELFEAAVRKSAKIPKAPFKESWAYFQAMLRLIRAYYLGNYRKVAWHTMAIVIAAVVYVVNPFDLIPDVLFGAGFLDDATIVAYALRTAKDSLDAFMQWEASQNPPG